MYTQAAGQREGIMAVLWSEFLALWFDRTRRRAVPLLLATLLLLVPSLPAFSDCSCELSGESSFSHHHGEGEANALGHHELGHHEHHPGESETRQFSSSGTSVSRARGAIASPGHVQLVVAGQVLTGQSAPVCCACPRAPLSSVSTVAPAPPQVNAESQNLAYVRVNALPVFRFDSLTGLFGRAGPPPDSKPKLLFLASLAGRAPPVSL